eukprot:CAMPEP_0182487502 /NCGR_PEP_ID=MMETSP1319-20130603/47790_1 /TAXON_ID=172717 /ORGANISM="Bolidomonas pacifica, Strain RCC208" /LENGTH=331 /DNA_ID=CAMNT_0024689625 /DNA_START=641 /DNA_END=1633 /DNA_ORIENTATION=-
MPRKRTLLSPLRPAIRAATGFSLTALRTALRTFTGISLSKGLMIVFRPFYRMWPLTVRAFLQPLLVMYYWPLIMIRATVMTKGYPLTSEKVLKGVEKLVVDKEFVPIAVTDELGVEIQDLPTLDEFERLAGDQEEGQAPLEEFEVPESEISKVEIFDVEPPPTPVEPPAPAPAAATSSALPRPSTQTLTGKWKLASTPGFKDAYDKYLSDLGQPSVVRTVALGLVSFTKEETTHDVGSGSLRVVGRNPKGTWDRTLELTGEGSEGVEVPTADSETVMAASHWDGDVHVSVLKDTKKYGGGDFRSRRYMDGEEYVCDTVFEKKGGGTAEIQW